ncbi:MAG TPA: hypothetical protein VFE47_24335 [Tepidisphaeraceae bacterium]|jgi:hypothetical protein|nr:hypothetical protein [Tepidisphaeraceae bacterium]
MITIRHIERLWNAKVYAKLSHELLDTRQEASFAIDGVERPCFVAALAMIRMDELAQAHLPLYDTLLRVLLRAQERDGGWGDPATTALCLRALLLGRGQGDAIEAGLAFLGVMQKDEGIWASGPMRRMPADPAATLFILYQLGDNARFREAVRFSEALGWFAHGGSLLSQELQALYQWASLRWRSATVETGVDEQTLFAAA